MDIKGEIISVGTEILLGDIIDTNSAYLTKELSKLALDIYYIGSVGDNSERLKNTIKTASERSNLIFLTGGLGPTDDDLTKEALCEVMGIELIEDQNEVNRLQNFFNKKGIKMPTNNLKQSLIPKGAIVLENSIGTASGLLVVIGVKYFILLPGPPNELEDVFEKQVRPWLKQNLAIERQFLQSHTLKFIGISESKLDWELKDLFQEQTNPTLALLAKSGEIHCRITAKASSEEEFMQLISPLKKQILERVGQYYYASDTTQLEEILGDLLHKKTLTVATAESCTGGLVAKRLTDIPGSSEYFIGSIIAYNNRVKENILKVSSSTLTNHGAVSEETAIAMAQGARKLLNTDIALSITGIAGPKGGTKDKPTGLVYISIVGENIKVCQKHIFTGTRREIRSSAATWALYLLKRSLEII